MDLQTQRTRKGHSQHPGGAKHHIFTDAPTHPHSTKPRPVTPVTPLLFQWVAHVLGHGYSSLWAMGTQPQQLTPPAGTQVLSQPPAQGMIPLLSPTTSTTNFQGLQ